jgi:hypothetical protein
MKKIIYFLMVSLAFTAFQVSTVAADPIMDARMAEDAATQAARQAEDVATQTARQAEDDARMAEERAAMDARMAEEEAARAAKEAEMEAQRVAEEAERAAKDAEMQAAMDGRMAEETARHAARQAEDEATQTARQAEDEAKHAARMKEDEERFAAGAPATGGHDGPPIDPRTITPENPAGTPFTQADEVKYQPYADECETSGGTISAGSLAILIGDGFTEEMVNGLCQMSANHDDCMTHPAGPARDACLAN